MNYAQGPYFICFVFRFFVLSSHEVVDNMIDTGPPGFGPTVRSFDSVTAHSSQLQVFPDAVHELLATAAQECPGVRPVVDQRQRAREGAGRKESASRYGSNPTRVG